MIGQYEYLMFNQQPTFQEQFEQMVGGLALPLAIYGPAIACIIAAPEAGAGGVIYEGASCEAALSSGARDLLLRYGTRGAAMIAFFQLEAMRDACPPGSPGYIAITQRLQMLEAYIEEAFPL